MRAMNNAIAERPSVYVVEDSDEIRHRLVDLLEEHDRVKVVGEAISSDAAIEGILKSQPTAVVLDLHLNRSSGLDVLRAVHPVAPGIVFIVLTGHADDYYRKVCMDLGASHFLDKGTDFSSIGPIIAGLNTSSRPQ
jgi:DNA-binding NarL/FixJ family response regulator